MKKMKLNIQRFVPDESVAYKYMTMGNGTKIQVDSAKRDGDGKPFSTHYQSKLTSGVNIKTINNTSLLGSGNISISTTDVQVNGTSITSGGVANLVTNTAYNSSSNKIATMSDLPSYATNVTAGLVKAPSTSALIVSSVGSLTCQERNFNNYVSGTSTSFISKGTLENALKGYHIEPTVLYDNSSGSKKTITGLNDSISNYTYLEIFYGWEGLLFGSASTRYDIALGGTINLGTSVLNNNAIYWGSSEWTPNGTTLTLTKGEYWRLQTTGSGARSTVNNIAIYKILGYK